MAPIHPDTFLRTYRLLVSRAYHTSESHKINIGDPGLGTWSASSSFGMGKAGSGRINTWGPTIVTVTVGLAIAAAAATLSVVGLKIACASLRLGIATSYYQVSRSVVTATQHAGIRSIDLAVDRFWPGIIATLTATRQAVEEIQTRTVTGQQAVDHTAHRTAGLDRSTIATEPPAITQPTPPSPNLATNRSRSRILRLRRLITMLQFPRIFAGPSAADQTRSPIPKDLERAIMPTSDNTDIIELQYLRNEPVQKLSDMNSATDPSSLLTSRPISPKEMIGRAPNATPPPLAHPPFTASEWLKRYRTDILEEAP